MSEIPDKLTIEQQLLVSAVADELSETTSIHQQVVLRMLAVASEHNLNAANLLQDLGIELKSSTANQIPFVVDDLNSGLPVVESLARAPGVVPESAVMALETARSRGLQKPLNQALLNKVNGRKSENAGVEVLNALDRLTYMALIYLYEVGNFTFLMLYIVPQFKSMYEEFGLELPLSMQYLLEVCNYVMQRWYVPAFIFILVGAYLIWRHPRVFTSYFTRWIPNRWLQPALSKRARNDLSLAWVVQTSDGLPETAKQFVNGRGVDAEELERVAGVEKAESSEGVLEVLTQKRVLSKGASRVASMASSRESAAWILRKMGQKRQTNSWRRGLSGVRMLLWTANILALVMGGWAALAIFQSLLRIITGLT